MVDRTIPGGSGRSDEGSGRPDLRHSLIPDHEPSAWLRDRVNEIGRRLIAGEVGACGCPHLRLPMVHAMWRPECVTCLPCRGLLATDSADPEDKTCDRCRRRAPGLVLGMVRTPAVVVIFGLCDECRRREVAA